MRRVVAVCWDSGSVCWRRGTIDWLSGCFMLGLKFVQRCEGQCHFNNRHCSPLPPPHPLPPSPTPFPAQYSAHCPIPPPYPPSLVAVPPSLLPWPMLPADDGCPPEPGAQGSDCDEQVVVTAPVATPDRISDRRVAVRSGSVYSVLLIVVPSWLTHGNEGGDRQQSGVA